MEFRVPSRIWLFLGSLMLLSVIPASASNISAASCSQAAVQAAINGAGDGDVVNVPAGNCTWTAELDPPCSSWTLQGAGTGSTNITVNESGSSYAISSGGCSGKSWRITGFSWLRQASAPSGSGQMFNFGGGTGISFRFDHNAMQPANGAGYGRWIWVNVPCIAPGCVVDHNTITDLGAEIEFELSSDGGDNYAGLTQWRSAMGLDNGTEIYFENNTFTFDNYFDNDMLDCINGGKYVFRYNTVVGNVIFNHGYDSVAESCLELSAYQNNMNGAYNGTNEAQAEVLFRGGTGVVYSNLMVNAAQANFLVTNYRSNNSGTNDIHTPFCGGGNSIDGNLTNGWQCYQQIGEGASSSTPGLASYPLYEWDNCTTGSLNGGIIGCTGTGSQNTITVYNNQTGASVDHTFADILQNRDFYDSVSSFNGTVGVGIGTSGNRPSSCTKGVAFWATDTSTLYQCSSANNWTSYYQPYTYPHPLVGGSSAPLPPSGLSASVL
jgi:hypothetical protein